MTWDGWRRKTHNENPPVSVQMPVLDSQSADWCKNLGLGWERVQLSSIKTALNRHRPSSQSSPVTMKSHDPFFSNGAETGFNTAFATDFSAPGTSLHALTNSFIHQYGEALNGATGLNRNRASYTTMQ
jgi:hypothetical protein